MTVQSRLSPLAQIAGIAILVVGGCDATSNSPNKPAAKAERGSAPAAQRKPEHPSVRSPNGSPSPANSTQPATEAPAADFPEPVSAKLPPLDEDRVTAHGIRKIEGRRLTLYTDLPADASIDGLPDLFESGVPDWCQYFGFDENELADWRVRGSLMRDRPRFIEAGLLPDDLEFLNAFTQGRQIWWQEQPTDYYRRHLMLHEGTHAVMFARYGTCGPAWYMEGLAELLGTHRLADGKLTLGYFPTDRDSVPSWGRIKMVQDTVRAGHALSIAEVMAYPINAELENEAYGWCWAIAAFLDGHPRYRERFRQLLDAVKTDQVNRRFAELFADDRQELNIEWRIFTHELDFGYDLVRNAIEFRPAEPLAASGGMATVAADRGWQSSAIHLATGESCTLTANGRYQIANDLKIWWCEPGGVTIRYYRGRPLGMLLALLLPDDIDDRPWPQPVAVGLRGEVMADRPSTLYLRINDAPGELADNAGSLEVRIDVN